MKTKITRRSAFAKLAGSTAAITAAAASLSERLGAADSSASASLKGKINHSVCKWCYAKVPLEALRTHFRKSRYSPGFGRKNASCVAKRKSCV